MKKLDCTPIKVNKDHPAAVLSCVFMIVSSIVRLVYYLPSQADLQTLLIHLVLPIIAAALFIIGTLLENRCTVPLLISAVFVGILFFVIKAFSFSPLHQLLCTLLYMTILTLYTLITSGILPFIKLLYPLFGLPLLYHIFVEDTQLYFFADPPVPFLEWLPEISVLCIMAALFSQAFAMKKSQ